MFKNTIHLAIVKSMYILEQADQTMNIIAEP